MGDIIIFNHCHLYEMPTFLTFSDNIRIEKVRTKNDVELFVKMSILGTLKPRNRCLEHVCISVQVKYVFLAKLCELEF